MHPGAQHFRFSCFGRRYVASLPLVSRLDPEALSDVEARLREALFSYEAGDPETLRALEGVHQALTTPFAPASRIASFPALRPPLERAERITRDLEAAVRSGRLRITLEERPIVRMARAPSAEAPLGPASTPEEVPTFFEAAFVDEIGEGIAGVEVVLTVAGEKHELTSDGSGKVRIDGVFATSFAGVRVVNVDAVRDALKPRWDEVRQGELFEPDENSTVVFLRGDTLNSFAITSETLFTVSIQPYVVEAQLLGMFFDTGKDFLLPSAIPSLKAVKDLYDRNPQSALLVVGHTDTSGEPNINDPLSLERAQSVAAYLTDQVDVWLARYESAVPQAARWGDHEDSMMMRTVATAENLISSNRVRAFQVFHNQQPSDRQSPSFQALAEDGIMGPLTRAQLIGDYMNADGTTLPAGIERVLHGCGENFPLDQGGEELDGAPLAEQDDQGDRRVELFFFDGQLGIQPPPPGANSGPGSAEYPEWRRRARETHRFRPGAGELISAHLSYLLRSNGSSFPLANKAFKLQVSGGTFQGVTDDEGFFEIDELPPDNYLLEVEGVQTLLAALPRDVERVPHTVLGAFLAIDEPQPPSVLVASIDPEEAAGLPPFADAIV